MANELFQIIDQKPFESNFIYDVESEIKELIINKGGRLIFEIADTHFQSKGKMLRPTFIKELASIYECELCDVLPWAVSCEILHNATLIHDDIQDGDEMRRGSPSLWMIHGIAQGINVGDFLLMISSLPIINSKHPRVLELLMLFTQMSTEIVKGQVLEININKLENYKNIHSKYLDCIKGKTSALFSGLANGVGILSGQSNSTINYLVYIFEKIGILFQMQDDVLDLYGDKSRGEQGCDVKEGKVSCLIAKHLQFFPNDIDLLRSILTKPRLNTTIEDINEIKELFERRKTKEAVIAEILKTESLLLAHPYLDENSDLKRLVENLIWKIMKPIKSVLQGEKV